MVHHITRIRCDGRYSTRPVTSRPEMYDDHLIAWLGHLHAQRGGLGSPPSNGRRLTEKQRARVRDLRPTMRANDLAAMFNVSPGQIAEVCADMNVWPVFNANPVESESSWWRSPREAAEALGVSPGSVRNCCLNYCQHVGGRKVTGVRLWYSRHRTREAWEAARAQPVVLTA